MPTNSGTAGKGPRTRRPVPRAWTVSRNEELVRRYVAAHKSSEEISRLAGISVRSVKRIKARLRGEGELEPLGDDAPLAGPPKRFEELSPEVQATLEDSPEGYRRFWERYWGFMPPHAFSWVQSLYNYSTGMWETDVLVNVPPGHLKSTVFSVRMSIWRVCQNRNFRRIIVSQTAALAKQFTREIAQELAYNELLVKDHGRFMAETMWEPAGGQFRVEGCTLTRGYNFLARGGHKTQIQGFRCDEIVVDDLVSIDDCETVDARDKISEYFHNYIESRPDPGGRCFVIGTRQHVHDLYAELAGLTDTDDRDEHDDPVKIWKHIDFPAVVDWETHKVLWDCLQEGRQHQPKGTEYAYPRCCRSYEYLLRQRKKMPGGSAAFEKTYQQRPLAEGEQLVRREWIFGEPGCLDRKRGRCRREEGDQRPFARIISIDPSPTMYWGWVVADVPYDRHAENFECSVLEVRREKMGVREAVAALSGYFGVYRESGHPIDYVLVERNIAQFFLQDVELQRLLQSNGVGRATEHSTTRNKLDPVYGIKSLPGDFENGRIRLPWGDPEAKDNSEILIGEATTYPQSSTDDVLHALWFIRFNAPRLTPRARAAPPGRPYYHIPPRLNQGYRFNQRGKGDSYDAYKKQVRTA